MMERKNGLMKDFKSYRPTVMENHTPLNWLLITVNTYSRSKHQHVIYLKMIQLKYQFHALLTCSRINSHDVHHKTNPLKPLNNSGVPIYCT